MLKVADVCSCMRRLHPDLQNRVKESTLLGYKKHLDPFLAYLDQKCELQSLAAEDIDLLAMEYRTEFELTKSQHIQLCAALEFFLPSIKGRLVYTREAIKGRTCAEPINHTIPMSYEIAYLFAAFHCSRGHERLGAALLVQMATGLRPSELLGICCAHVFVPLNFREAINIRLGSTYSTKVKREQFVQVFASAFPLAYKLLRWLVAATKDGEKLFPFSYSTYNNSFGIAEMNYGLTLRLTAHSGRSGYATSRILRGDDPAQVQTAGRWRSDTSFRTYVDVAGSLHTKAQVEAHGLLIASQWCQDHIEDYFPSLRGAHAPSSKSRQLGGAKGGYASPRSSEAREPLLAATGARRPEQVPEASVAQRAAATVDATQHRRRRGGQSQLDASSAPVERAKGRGRGRGRLLPAGRPTQSVFE